MAPPTHASMLKEGAVTPTVNFDSDSCPVCGTKLASLAMGPATAKRLFDGCCCEKHSKMRNLSKRQL